MAPSKTLADISPQAARRFDQTVDPALMGAPVPSGWAQIRPTGVQVLPGESDQQVVVVDRARDACVEGAPGLVSASGTVIGSVLWEGLKGGTPTSTRGWAIVPKADPVNYAFWCAAP